MGGPGAQARLHYSKRKIGIALGKVRTQAPRVKQ